MKRFALAAIMMVAGCMTSSEPSSYAWPSQICCSSGLRMIAGSSTSDIWGIFITAGAGAADGVQHFDGTTWNDLHVLPGQSWLDGDQGPAVVASGGPGHGWYLKKGAPGEQPILIDVAADGTVVDHSIEIAVTPAPQNINTIALKSGRGGVFGKLSYFDSQSIQYSSLFQLDGTGHFVSIPLPQQPEPLEPMLVLGPDDAYWLTTSGQLTHYKDGAWTLLSGPTPQTPAMIDASGPNDVWILGEGGGQQGTYFNGNNWYPFTMPPGPPLAAISDGPATISVIGSGTMGGAGGPLSGYYVSRLDFGGNIIRSDDQTGHGARQGVSSVARLDDGTILVETLQMGMTAPTTLWDVITVSHR